MSYTVLGIDPGSRNTGIAVLRKEGSRYIMLHCSVLKVGHFENHFDRLEILFNEIGKLVSAFKPDTCAIETPLYGKDPLALLKLGRAQAAAILAVIQSGLPIEEYYPKMVKKSITGNGNASKEQVAYMLDKVLSLNGAKLPADATDALAVAWCHATRDTQPGKTALKSSKKSHQNNARSDWSKFLSDNPDRIKEHSK